MNQYHVWDLDMGHRSDWFTSRAEGRTPVEALRSAVATASPFTAAFKDGHIVVVANAKGGHGQAGIFRIKREKKPKTDADHILEVVV